MAERREGPILFSGPMVRAILAVRKTQTRRMVKPQPDPVVARPVPGQYFQRPCPYGAPGDRLWVRETHFRWGRWVRKGTTRGGCQTWRFRAIAPPFGPEVVFTLPPGASVVARRGHYGWHQRPSIFLERQHARLALEVTEVRVQRLQEISEEDAQAEGVECVGGNDVPLFGAGQHLHPSEAFAELWDSINGDRKGASWAANPWVWAITFTRVSAETRAA